MCHLKTTWQYDYSPAVFEEQSSVVSCRITLYSKTNMKYWVKVAKAQLEHVSCATFRHLLVETDHLFLLLILVGTSTGLLDEMKLPLWHSPELKMNLRSHIHHLQQNQGAKNLGEYDTKLGRGTLPCQRHFHVAQLCVNVLRRSKSFLRDWIDLPDWEKALISICWGPNVSQSFRFEPSLRVTSITGGSGFLVLINSKSCSLGRPAQETKVCGWNS